jgi:hypothetical protein
MYMTRFPGTRWPAGSAGSRLSPTITYREAVSDTDTAREGTDADESSAGPIIESRRIRGRHLVGITAFLAVLAAVGAYFVGWSNADEQDFSERDQAVVQATVVAQAVGYGDLLLEEQQRWQDDEDLSEDERALAEQIGYDDLLEDTGDLYDEQSEFAVEVHEIKDDNGLPEGSEDEEGDEVDDNSLVQVQIGDVSACLDLEKLETDGADQAVTPGACEA